MAKARVRIRGEYFRKYFSKSTNKDRQKIRKSKWQKDNKDRVKGIKLKYSFGISLEEYNQLLEKQEYRCAICRKEKIENGRSFAVDHDHKTGRVRGLLCTSCNCGIGFLRDSKDLLLRAITYLKD